MEKIYIFDDVLDNKNCQALVEEFNEFYNPVIYAKTEQTSPYIADGRLNYPLWGALYKPMTESKNTALNRAPLGDNLCLIHISELIKIKAQKALKKNIKLRRVNTNVQFYGMESWPHKDGKSNEWTFLIFANDLWHPTWGGSFVVHRGDNDRDYVNVPLMPNRGVLFRADLYHYGTAPSRYCVEPRFSLAATFTEIT